MVLIKSIVRISILGACIFLIILIPSCFIANQSNKAPTNSQNSSTESYDGVYADLKFVGGGYSYTGFEGTFRNLTGKQIRNLKVQVSFFDGNSKLQISNDSINELGAGEDWRFKINFVDKNADTVRIDGFTGSYGVNRYSDLNVISEKSFLEKKKYKKQADEAFAKQNKEIDKQAEIHQSESILDESKNQNEPNKLEPKKPNKNQKLLEAKYRGVRLRAESGGVEAMFELSELLRNGIGCETNIDESNQWLKKFNQNQQSEPK